MYGAIIVDRQDLLSTPIVDFERKLKEKMVALKVITGYGFDDSNWMLVHELKFYALSLRRERCSLHTPRHKELKGIFGANVDTNKCYVLVAWADDGSQSVFHRLFTISDYKEPIPLEVLNELFGSLRLCGKGLVKCSDCGKECNAKSGNRYFAGTYCDDCWLGRTGKYQGKKGWQEVERRETYN